jgi:phenylpropionate dioxygenase-like ring-hydroxylating dioxygenase large terminal subunit
MLSREESELLTRVGPGTAMGDLMRQYWLPAAKSSELVADGPPVRLALLGEKLIAFRDSSGRVGVMDHRCPHRCASLFYGRNEENGLRCVYHGWKYDVDGKCVDQANIPPHQDFKDKVRAKAYPARERNGIVWTYMGPRQEPPPLPAIEAALLPVGMTDIVFVQRECNWLQAIEGEIDTSHFGFLHAGHLDHRNLTPDNPHYYTVFSRTPEYHCTETPWGTMYAAYRDADAEHVHYRMAQYLFPFWTEIPQGDFEQDFNARAWVPMDDTHTMFVQLASDLRSVQEYVPNDTSWFGRWRLTANRANDHLIDRDAQRRMLSYTGIEGVHTQDQAITESMGPIVDHSFENLAPSDRMIAQTRRRILRAVRAFKSEGVVPPGVDDPAIFMGARSGQFVAPRNAEWQRVYRDKLAASRRVTSLVPAE